MTCSKQDSQVITKKVKSQYVADREVSIFVPGEKYGPGPWPVLYMHDGQNIFDPSNSFSGQEWEVDETLERLIGEGFPPCLVVGIHNTDLRFQEYMPQKPYCTHSTSLTKTSEPNKQSLLSDAYLKFIVEELKPKIDKSLLVKSKREHTFIAGSSMGGLISLYAISEYPDVFGGAACMSTHWPIALDNSQKECSDELVKHFGFNLPDPATHKIYFDYGTKGLDASYEPWQLKMDVLMHRGKYTEGKNWITKKFEGDDHNEEAWKNRFEIPLRFLLAD